MSDRLGQKLGNYRLTRLLGQGGFADVFLGTHTFLGREAAIKVLQGQMTAKDLQAFIKEAQIIASLKHPNILNILEFGVDDDKTPFLVMDYIPDGTLRDRHPEGSVLSIETILPYVKQMAAALQYAHDQNLIHRDIKPENMLVKSSNTIVLCDFGIAVNAHNTTSLKSVDMIGTVSYMAPESLEKKACPASDQYALAIVVYEWLCGKLPFEGSTKEVAVKQISVPPSLLSEEVPGITSKVEQVVLKALAKDPQERFASVQAFAEALEKASTQEFPISEYVPEEPPKKDPKPPSKRRVALLVAVALMVMLGSTGLYLAFFQPPRTTASESTPTNRPTLSGTSSTTQGSSVTGTRTHHPTPTGIPSPVKGTPTLTPRNTPTPAPTSYGSSPGSYPMYGFDSQHTHNNPNETRLSTGNVSGLAPDWKTATGNGIRGNSSPVLGNGMVYIGASDGHVYAFNMATGHLSWSSTLYFGSLLAPLTLANGLLYVAPNGPTLYALNALSGNLVWRAPLGGNVTYSAPLVVNTALYIGAADAKLYAFNASNGQQLWSTTLNNRIDTPPSYFSGVIYITATSANDTDQNMYAINASNGNIEWTATLQGSSQSSPAIANGVVYVGSAAGAVGLQAFNASGCGSSTCSPVWFASLDGAVNSSPAVANGVVYIGTTAGTLYAFNTSTHRQLWIFHTGADIYSSPTIANGVIYFGSEDSTMYALDATTGAKLWSYSTGNSVDSSPAVLDGVVYIGSTNGYFYAFHLSK